MRVNQDVLDAIERLRAEGRLIERPHVVALPAVPVSAPPANESEKKFMARVRKLASDLGWLDYHTHDSRRSEAGFPDLVLVRERVVYVELKTNKGRLTAAQKDWIDRLKEAGAEVRVWRPSDWATIEEVLK